MTKEDWKELMFAVKAVSFTFAFFAMAMVMIWALVTYAESKCTEGEIYDGKICENHRMRNFNLKDLEQYPGLGGLAKPKSKTIIVPIITR